MTGLRWETVQREIAQRLETSRTALESATGDNVLRLQARIKLMREILAFPETLRRDPDSRIGESEAERYHL